MTHTVLELVSANRSVARALPLPTAASRSEWELCSLSTLGDARARITVMLTPLPPPRFLSYFISYPPPHGPLSSNGLQYI